jgi:hypothetical protein
MGTFLISLDTHLDMNVDFQKISWYLNVVRSGRQQVRAKG